MREEKQVDHPIKVSFIELPTEPEKVQASPNPLSAAATGVSHGDTVTWSWTNTLGSMRELQVIFLKVAMLEVDPITGEITAKNIQDCNPMGPFSSLMIGMEKIVGTVRDDTPTTTSQSRRYYYKLVENGKNLVWKNSLDWDDMLVLLGLGGGIDTPKTPP